MKKNQLHGCSCCSRVDKSVVVAEGDRSSCSFFFFDLVVELEILLKRVVLLVSRLENLTSWGEC